MFDCFTVAYCFWEPPSKVLHHYFTIMTSSYCMFTEKFILSSFIQNRDIWIQNKLLIIIFRPHIVYIHIHVIFCSTEPGLLRKKLIYSQVNNLCIRISESVLLIFFGVRYPLFVVGAHTHTQNLSKKLHEFNLFFTKRDAVNIYRL